MEFLPKIMIFNSLQKCKYSNADIILSNIWDLHDKYNNLVLLYQIHRDDHNIIMINITLQIFFKEKSYPIEVLIYLDSEYPEVWPRCYIRRTKESLLINEKNPFINPSNFEIYIYKLSNTINLKSTLIQLVSEIEACFTREFPIYSAQINKPIYGDCLLNIYEPETYQIVFEEHDIKNSNSNIPNQGSKIHRNQNYNENKMLIKDESEEIQIQSFTERDIRRILEEELIEVLSKPFQKRLSDLLEDSSEISLLKSRFLKDQEKKKEIIKQKDLVIKQIEEINSITEAEVQNNMLYIKENENRKLKVEDLPHLVDINPKEIVDIVAEEAMLEELMLILRKSYDKQIFSLDETIKLYRTVSGVIFKKQYIKDKLMRGSKHN